MKRIVVTGATGFIGTHICRRLLQDPNNSIIGVGNFYREKIAVIPSDLAKNPNFQFYVRDLSDSGYECFIGADEVIHLASRVSGIDVYVNYPYDIFAVNTKIDANVIQFASLAGAKKFFYASSSHIYKTRLDHDPLRENDPLGSDLSYGVAKHVGEMTLEYHAQQNSFMRIAVGRLCGIYGPGQSYDYNDGSLIPVMCAKINDLHETFQIRTTGDEYRSYCYIDDAIDAILMLMNKLDESPFLGPYNICTNTKHTVIDICESIIRASGKNVSLIKCTNRSKIDCQWCSPDKIKKEIGWGSKVNLDNGINNTYIDIKNRMVSIV